MPSQVINRHRYYVQIAALVITLVALVSPAQAYARPVMLHSEPVDGAVLSGSPARIRIWMSETVDLEADSLVLLDGQGRAQPVTGYAEFYQPSSVGLADRFDPLYLYLCSVQAAALPSVLVVELPRLTAASYQLSWKTKGLRSRVSMPGSLVFAIRPDAQTGRAGALPGDISLQQDDLLATLHIRPNIPGQNFIGLTIVSTRRPLPRPIQQVRMYLSGPGGRERTIDAISSGEGRWQIASEAFDVAGEWRIEISVIRPGLLDTRLITTWHVSEQPAIVNFGSVALYVLLLAIAMLVAIWKARHLMTRPI